DSRLRGNDDVVSGVACIFTGLRIVFLGSRAISGCVAVRVVLLPAPVVGAHGVDAAFCLPAERFHGVGGDGVAGGGVTGTAIGHCAGDFLTAGFTEGVDHVEHAVALAGAEVGGNQAATGLQHVECVEVALCQVHDVNVVAHAGAVGGGVVAAE